MREALRERRERRLPHPEPRGADGAGAHRQLRRGVRSRFARRATTRSMRRAISIGRVRVLNASRTRRRSRRSSQFTTELNSTHNCWTTEDRQYVLATDETGGGRVTSWDISDLSAPIQVDGFTADASGDAHNVHIRGDLAYVAHYTRGRPHPRHRDPTDMRLALLLHVHGRRALRRLLGRVQLFPEGDHRRRAICRAACS